MFELPIVTMTVLRKDGKEVGPVPMTSWIRVELVTNKDGSGTLVTSTGKVIRDLDAAAVKALT